MQADPGRGVAYRPTLTDRGIRWLVVMPEEGDVNLWAHDEMVLAALTLFVAVGDVQRVPNLVALREGAEGRAPVAVLSLVVLPAQGYQLFHRALLALDTTPHPDRLLRRDRPRSCPDLHRIARADSPRGARSIDCRVPDL